jgi:ribonuclease E
MLENEPNEAAQGSERSEGAGQPPLTLFSAPEVDVPAAGGAALAGGTDAVTPRAQRASGGRGRRTASRPPGPPDVPDGIAAAGAPTLTAPFASPFPQAGPASPVTTAAESGGDQHTDRERRGVPAASFQAPQVLFQPPAAVTAAPPAAAGRAPAGEAAAEARPGDQAGAPADRGDADEEVGNRRRKRRGGRSRGRDGEHGGESGQADTRATDGPGAQATQDGREPRVSGDQAGAAAGPAAAEREADDTEEGGSRRRRRRRRGQADADQAGPDEPPNTVVHVRPPRTAEESRAEVQGVRGSTRLEAKRQRRREGRESGRRRPPIITESEFLARREAVDRVMVVRQRGGRTQIGVLEDGVLVEHYVDKSAHQSFVGNVYLGKVQNVLPSMEAAFVDIGKGRNAVLYAGEVNFDASGLEGESKRIESALKSGQSVLVQVTKDPVGHKGARLTSQVSLPGRYLVYVPGASMMGISRKLPDKERTRLKQILKQVMPEGAGVIVRTAAEGASEEELSRDVSRLSAQWESIELKAKSANAPELLYSEPDLTIRVVRDIFNEDFSKLVVAGEESWTLVDEYVRYVAPHLAGRVERWGDEQEDLFARYRIDEQISKALERKVWLPSGGSLVIDKTEAMTVVDVNTGKFTGQGGNLEETVTRNNLEAAEEIVRQLRLRDVGGIIVIDFIDMVLESNRDLVLRRLLECLARDRTKHQVAEVTSLGLVQMTRKRVGSGLLEAFSESCECCNGRGVIISLELAEQPGDRGRGDGRGGTQGRPGRTLKLPDTRPRSTPGPGPDVAASATGAEAVAGPEGDAGDPAGVAAVDGAPTQGRADGASGSRSGSQGGRRRRRASRDQGPPEPAGAVPQPEPAGSGDPAGRSGGGGDHPGQVPQGAAAESTGIPSAVDRPEAGFAPEPADGTRDGNGAEPAEPSARTPGASGLSRLRFW